MSIYRKTEQGKLARTAGSVVQRWNNRIFPTIHSVENEDTDYYDIDPVANKYILELSSNTEFQLIFNEPNDTSNVYIRYAGRALKLTLTNREPILVRTLSKRLNVYTLDINSGLIWLDPPGLTIYQEFEKPEDFPLLGTESALYLARKQNVALEGMEEKLEDYNMLFRWDDPSRNYTPIAGQGSGGGDGGGPGTGTTAPRVTPYPAETPIMLTHAFGQELILGYFYSNGLYNTASRIAYVNDVLVNTASITTGANYIDVTKYLKLGLNTIRLFTVDPEGRQAQVIYRVTADSVVVKSPFNDTKVFKNEMIVLPFSVSTSATVRTAHYILDGVETEELLSASNQSKIIDVGQLSHGAHTLEIYVVAGFVQGSLVAYTIESNHLVFNLIYDDGEDLTPIIASKFNKLEQEEGVPFSVDYIVYTPGYEFSDILLYIDNQLQRQLSILLTKHNWNISTLSPGEHTLKIVTGVTEKSFIINVAQSEVLVEIVKDSFLKLYLDAFGKSNSEVNRTQWNNLYGPTVVTTLNGLNYTSDGWIDNGLRLTPGSNADIGFKPFQGEVSPAGKTIEFDIKTSKTTSENAILAQSINNNIGFIIRPNSVELKASNLTTVAKFKEDEHLTISFVISPVENMIFTFINGIISGVNFLTNTTSFRQLVPATIILNPDNTETLDIYAIRYYDRALEAQEVLNNYIASIDNITLKLNKYNFNDIYDDYGNPSKDKMSSKIPVMMIEGTPLPNAKLRPRPFCNVYFEHPYDPSKNFERTGMNTDIDVQGTSSMQYPIKNFKIRLDQKLSSSQRQPYAMEPNIIPERTFTLKADYMESSHSHNTGLAKLFDSMYASYIPPKEFDSRVRTAVYGYPCVLFHRVNATDPWVYKGVYNFNLDKDAETALGLDNEREWEPGNSSSVLPATQSFEITFNADSGAGAFQANDLGGMISSFEPRYPAVDEFDLFSDLNISAQQMLAEVKIILTSWTTIPALRVEIADADYEEIVALYDREFSIYHAQPEYIKAFRVLINHYTNLRTAIQWVMDNNDQPSFKTEFEEHFNKEYSLKYVIATLVFGLVDNLGKNTMLNTWDGQTWYPCFYDIDTSMGLENQGRNIHDYDIEIGEIGTYATSDSWLWKNILNYFKVELDTIYSELRQNVFNYTNILEFLNEQQISKISESQYNIDAYAKYIGITTAWLWMAQGSTLEHKKRWLTLRLAFLDSKFLYQDYINDSIAIRMNIPDGYTSAHVTLTPTITQYAGVRWGNIAGGTTQTKTKGNTAVTLNAPIDMGTGEVTNMEVWIYGAKWIKDIGDLSHLYPSSVSVEKATRLEELIIGSNNTDYINDKLDTVAVGSNTYLKTVDVRNAINLGTNPLGTQVLDLSGATNIRTVLANNTQLKGVRFADGSAANRIELPASITELVLRNMANINSNNLVLAGTNNVETLWTENLPNIDVVNLFSTMPNIQRVRMIGIKYSVYGLSYINALINSLWDSDNNEYKVMGLNSQGLTIDKPVITGTFKILSDTVITDTEINRIKTILPDLNLDINFITPGLTLVERNDTMEVVGYNGPAVDVLTIPAAYHKTLNSINNVILNDVGWLPVASIGAEALKGKSIKEIYMPNHITKIGNDAFADNSILKILVIPLSVTLVGSKAFNNNPQLNLLVHQTETPAGWAPDWNGNVTNITWSLPTTLRQFVYNVGGGTTVPSLISNILLKAPLSTTRYGYNFVRWVYNGETVTFPYIPKPTDPATVIITAEWDTWKYTIRYMRPTSDIDSTLILHNTQIVEYGEILGDFFTENTTGSTQPIVPGLIWRNNWKDANGNYVTKDFTPTQNVYTQGYVLDLSALFLMSAGLTFVFDASYNVYNVTKWVPTTTSRVDLFIPGEWDDGINGTCPVRDVDLAYKNLTQSLQSRLGSVEIEESNTNLSRTLIVTGLYTYPTYLTSVKIPLGITHLGTGALASIMLSTVDLPDGLISIGQSAFHGSSIKFIKIPNTVITIGSSAFYSCSKLHRLYIPLSVTTIGSGFISSSTQEGAGKPQILLCQASTIPTGWTGTFNYYNANILYNVPEDMFGDGDFYYTTTGDTTTIHLYNNKNSIVDLSLFESLSAKTIIGACAFSGHEDLTSITLPSNLVNVQKSAFNRCINLANIIIPTGVLTLGEHAFQGCTSLASITLPEGMTTLGDYIFQDCTQLNGVTLPTTLTYLGDYSFSRCSSLTGISIPGGTTYVRRYAFENCTNLINVILSEGVQNIGPSGFAYCRKITSIILPTSLNNIQSMVFYGCTTLHSITVKRTTPPSLAGGAFDDTYADKIFYIPVGTYTNYSTATNWSVYASRMEEVSI